MLKSPLSCEQIVEMSGDGLWTMDGRRRTTSMNARMGALLGFAPDDLIGRPVADLMFDEDLQAHEARMAGRAAGVGGRYEQRFRRADGSPLWCLVRETALLGPGGEIEGSIGIFTDISDRKQVEEALRDSEHSLRELQRVAGVGWFVHDISARTWRGSGALDELFGIGQAFPRTMESWLSLVHADDHAEVQARFQRTLAGGEPFSCEYRIVRPKDRQIRWVQGLGEFIDRGGGQSTRVFGTIQDLTEHMRQDQEQRHLESRLLQAQKLESLGVLAGGIAHDFNNLLTSILGNADLALLDLPPGTPAADSIVAIEAAARRAAEIARQMLAYSGHGRFVLEPLHLSRIVLEMKRMLEVAVSKGVSLRWDLDGHMNRAEVDPGQIRQLVMNLTVNASEAIGSNGGVVSIRTGNTTEHALPLDVDYLGEDIPDGRFVFVEVSDTGPGIDEATRLRLFDPFFSTKFPGRGLGLPAVLGIVRGHRGHIQVLSEPGHGATFRAIFPAVDAPVSRPIAGVPPDAATAKAPTVLVVDDEDSVRLLAKRFVERCGYRVLTATNGVEALAMVREHPGDIGCVLLDLTMPKMDGEATLCELRHIEPDLPVVMASGYQGQEIKERLVDQALAGFIQKPYRLADLKATLDSVLA
ncbi:MAG TPA: PAS domain S-box protein [Vicinamibacterales bacterium]